MNYLITVCCFFSMVPLNGSVQDSWVISTSWFHSYLADSCAQLPSSEIARIHYIQCTEDIGRLFNAYYGAKIATSCTQYMSGLSRSTLSLIEAYRKKDLAAIDQSLTSWRLTATNFCTFLSKTNPYLRFTPLRNLLFDYLNGLIKSIQYRQEKEWKKDAETYDLILRQASTIGATFSQALFDAFPVRKLDDKTTRRIGFSSRPPL